MLNAILFRSHLESDETLVRVVHKHWLLGMRALFWPTLFLGISVWLVTLNQARGFLIFVGFWDCIFLIWWLRNFFDYFLDAWIISDHGIVDVAWHGWFHRQSTRVLFSDLQGVSYEIKGVIGTMLRYGTLSMEKISTGTSISLEYVRHPKQVEVLILKTMEAYLHSKNMKDAKQVQELLSALVAERIQLHEMEDAGDSEEG